MHGLARAVSISTGIEAIQERVWPGNVRQLQNAVDGRDRRAGRSILPEHIEAHDSAHGRLPVAADSAEPLPLLGLLAAVERRAIESALLACGGNVPGCLNASASAAASSLIIFATMTFRRERKGLHPFRRVE